VEASEPYFKVTFSILLEKVRKTMQNLSQDT